MEKTCYDFALILIVKISFFKKSLPLLFLKKRLANTNTRHHLEFVLISLKIFK